MYRVKDWNSIYESPETRKVKTTRYVCTPNKHDGSGYRRMALHPRAVELFAAWNAIIQVASKCPERGVLLDRDGWITPEDMELKTLLPASLFAFAFDFFSSGKKAWLERGNENPGAIQETLLPPAGTPGDSGGFGNQPENENPGASREIPADGRGVPVLERGERGEREILPGDGPKGDFSPAPKARPRNVHWDALVDAFQLNPVSKSECSNLGMLAATLRQKGATPADIPVRMGRYRARYPGVALTPNALVKHWDLLVPEAVGVAPRGQALSDQVLGL